MTDFDAAVDLQSLRHRPLLFVADLDEPVLDDADHHHFRRVLRVAHGADIVLGDGTGRWRTARFAETAEPTGPVRTAAAPAVPISVAFTPVKGTKPEWMVQKLTELGIDRITPVLTERSVVRWDAERSRRQHQRLLGAAREACLQSRRLRLPTVDQVVELPELLTAEEGAVLADPGGGPPGEDTRTIVVGPEGGFADAELDGRATVRLPGNILRAETAVLAAATTLAAIRAGLVKPAAT